MRDASLQQASAHEKTKDLNCSAIVLLQKTTILIGMQQIYYCLNPNAVALFKNSFDLSRSPFAFKIRPE